MRRLKLKSFLIFFLSASLFGQTKSDPDTQRLYRISQREQKIYQQLKTNPDFYTTEDLERRVCEIVLAYSNYLSENPDDVSALILYGKLLRRIGETEQAFKIFLKADAIDPGIAVVKQQIGNYLVETDNGKAALTFYLNAVELEPGVPEYNYAIGEILHIFRDEFVRDELFTHDSLDREMIKAFQAAARLDPENFDGQMRLGEAYYDLITPDWKAALLHWEKLRKATPDYNELRCQILDLHRARVLTKLGRNEEARELANEITQPALQAAKKQILVVMSPAAR
jgi:tetratricopeptide (TPR) repeat protein